LTYSNWSRSVFQDAVFFSNTSRRNRRDWKSLTDWPEYIPNTISPIKTRKLFIFGQSHFTKLLKRFSQERAV
jgi:hypothetical protein